ncbi:MULTISPECIES: aldehyde dehydrogenase [unclassified Ruegeria]|uniref:aldehyde dehydrogenase n=1 Tax=unclassified Ruegeria TaxID=2625375 RepID=UPI0014879C3B|nr:MULTISPECIES: aldehyde dehydrogenase [unclassified Ruegeria]NOD75610.1 aldehyde dehydrogenase family protein [Ruegeria sp. HKCCD4332]NOD90984.1 aldehyde dehydrogenase family protein [Ruegeria sp. HKCCD4318]NOE16362.1 aldehyde dehydrogenase family protein [Ruegeria sp. HKCCD4318-2]NOG10153.1 aldehyde dehydrogenase [Ruegeria sp. HKCCD4315]
MHQKPHFQLYIDGEWVEGSRGQVMKSQNPATGEEWSSFACASAEDVDRAISAARRSLEDPAWRDMTQTSRGRLLLKLAELIERNAKHLGEFETKDSGKLLVETAGQTAYVGDYYRYYAGLADKIEGAVLPIDKPDMHVFTKREPIGVVVAIVPWNAQMFLTATKLGPALAAGCSVVLKASEIAPAPILEFARLIDEAGFPPGVISVITGDAENCSVPLTRHPEVDRIAFTGGPETARHVVRNSAENFAVTTLELGGKSPIIVFDDANLDGAANGLIAGNFGASGQSCVAGSRGLIHRPVLEALAERIEEKMKGIVIGDPLEQITHIGPLCTYAQVSKIQATLAKATEQGARIRFGGAPLDRPGNYMAPTLVECTSAETETLKVEMFGPVMTLLPFDTEDEAIALANDTPFGLGSGVFTENVARAHRIASRLKSGICWINTYRAVSPIAPFGGYNQSGYGREAGVESIHDYTRTKTVWLNTSEEPMSNPFVIR